MDNLGRRYRSQRSAVRYSPHEINVDTIMDADDSADLFDLDYPRPAPPSSLKLIHFEKIMQSITALLSYLEEHKDSLPVSIVRVLDLIEVLHQAMRRIPADVSFPLSEEETSIMDRLAQIRMQPEDREVLIKLVKSAFNCEIEVLPPLSQTEDQEIVLSQLNLSRHDKASLRQLSSKYRSLSFRDQLCCMAKDAGHTRCVSSVALARYIHQYHQRVRSEDWELDVWQKVSELAEQGHWSLDQAQMHTQAMGLVQALLSVVEISGPESIEQLRDLLQDVGWETLDENGQPTLRENNSLMLVLELLVSVVLSSESDKARLDLIEQQARQLLQTLITQSSEQDDGLARIAMMFMWFAKTVAKHTGTFAHRISQQLCWHLFTHALDSDQTDLVILYGRFILRHIGSADRAVLANIEWSALDSYVNKGHIPANKNLRETEELFRLVLGQDLSHEPTLLDQEASDIKHKREAVSLIKSIIKRK